MLRGVALLGGTPPEVLATLPREEELPLTDRQDRVGIHEVAQIAVREHPKAMDSPLVFSLSHLK